MTEKHSPGTSDSARPACSWRPRVPGSPPAQRRPGPPHLSHPRRPGKARRRARRPGRPVASVGAAVPGARRVHDRVRQRGRARPPAPHHRPRCPPARAAGAWLDRRWSMWENCMRYVTERTPHRRRASWPAPVPGPTWTASRRWGYVTIDGYRPEANRPGQPGAGRRPARHRGRPAGAARQLTAPGRRSPGAEMISLRACELRVIVEVRVVPEEAGEIPARSRHCKQAPGLASQIFGRRHSTGPRGRKIPVGGSDGRNLHPRHRR